MRFGEYLARGVPLRDRFGCELHTPSLECAAAVDAYFECVLRYGQNWAVALEAATADPGLALAQVLAADFAMACEDVPEARRCLERPTRTPSPRAALYRVAMAAWVAGDLEAATAGFEAVLRAFPGDLFALKRAQLLAFFLGDAARMVAAADVAAAASEGRPFYHGMAAFALEQAGRLAEAEAEGRKATALHPPDAWAHHAVAHALYFQGRLQEGVEWLLSLSRHWTTCCSFMLTHNWWHVALSFLDLDNLAECARYYDEQAWGVDKGNVQDQLGALGMLLKWQLRVEHSPELGAGPGADRWRDVIEHALKKPQVHLDPLYDVLLLYALGLAGRAERAEAFAEEAVAAHAGKETIVRALQGALEFGRGRYAEAVPLLARRDALGLLGGSSEQRDVLEEVRLFALTRTDAAAARALLEEREAERPGIGATQRLLSSSASAAPAPTPIRV